VGIENVNSDFATFVRTIVILLAAGAIVYVTGHWQQPSGVSAKTWFFLVLSGAATGASWICYFRALKLGEAARVVPIAECRVCVPVCGHPSVSAGEHAIEALADFGLMELVNTRLGRWTEAGKRFRREVAGIRDRERIDYPGQIRLVGKSEPEN